VSDFVNDFRGQVFWRAAKRKCRFIVSDIFFAQTKVRYFRISLGIHQYIFRLQISVYDIALKQLFEIADKDGNGVLDREELKDALQTLGFSYLNDSQIEKILGRADADENAVIDFEEFVAEAPKTLRVNLVKLAKKNGAELGFLS